MGQLKSIHTYTLFSGTAYNKLTYDNYGHVSAKVIPSIFFILQGITMVVI